MSRSRFPRCEEMIVAGVADPGPYQNPKPWRRYRCPLQHAAVSAKRSLPRSTCRALKKLVQRIDGSEDRPGGNRGDDGKEQCLNGKFPTLFARKITSG